MGAAYSIQLPSNPTTNQYSTAEQLCNAITAMMDPKSAIKNMKADHDLHIIYANPYETLENPKELAEEQPQDSSPATSQGTFVLDTISLDDSDLSEIQPQYSTDVEDEKQQVQDSDTLTLEELKEPVDLYMSRIAPPALVRMVSSGSSSKVEKNLAVSPMLLTAEHAV